MLPSAARIEWNTSSKLTELMATHSNLIGDPLDPADPGHPSRRVW
jgi:hypothetical protein